MTKRKTKSASKYGRSRKIGAKAQRANQAVVRSPRKGRLRSVAAGSTELPPKLKQEAFLGDNPMTAFQDHDEQMKDIVSSKGFDLSSSAMASVRAYQAKLAEVAQANLQFAFEYAQRLATIRSPVELLNVMVEFTSRRIAMFQKYSIEMAEVPSGESMRGFGRFVRPGDASF